MRKSSRSLIGAAAVALLVAGATPVACGSDTDSKPSTGGADGGGSGGTGGIAPGGGGTPAGGVGGKSGSGGTGATDAGIDWGADPKWESTGQVAAGCPIERLANPKEMKAFVWKTCSWAADCEEAVFNPKLVGAAPAFSGTAHDDGSVARVAFAFLNEVITVVTDGAGGALDGFRGSEGPDKCILWSASIWGSRTATMVGPSGFASIGGFLADVGGNKVNAFTLSSVPPGGPQRYPLGEKRWLWWWAPVDRFSTVSAVDGSDFVIFAKAMQPGYAFAYNEPTSAGSIFLFDEYQATDAGGYQRVVAWSDGLQAPQTYLRPTDTKDDFGSAAYAHTQVGFFRGIGRKDTNLYESVELWSSPFSVDPALLVPKQMAKLNVTSITTAWAGAFGRMAFPAFAPPYGKQEILVWDLQTAKQTSHVLPEDHDLKAILGISREHVYVAAAKPNAGPSAYLVRYPVP